jgi:hypothetical protein
MSTCHRSGHLPSQTYPCSIYKVTIQVAACSDHQSPASSHPAQIDGLTIWLFPGAGIAKVRPVPKYNALCPTGMPYALSECVMVIVGAGGVPSVL